MFNPNTRHWSTPAVIAAGVFMSVSGVLMFFGVHDPVTMAHEWIGLAFVAAILFHILTHWRGVKGYFSQRLALGVVAVIALATTSLIVLAATHEGGGMGHKVFATFERAPLTEIAPLLDQSPDALVAKLQSGGFQVAGTSQSIQEIASRNGTRAPELMHLLFD